MKNKRNDDKQSRMSFMQRLGVKLDIPADVINGIFIELHGRNNLTVKGCRKILVYTTEEVKLRLYRQNLLVRGSNLYCTAYHSGVIEIDGVIDSISFVGNMEV